jgi:hypothetical protein
MGYSTLQRMPRLRLGELGDLPVSVWVLVRVRRAGVVTLADLRTALAHPRPSDVLGIDDTGVAALRRGLAAKGK